MSAFEELGVLPELIKAVEELEWLIPQPVQAECVPLILGGGDVLAAAETGSGKTGAFALPILQIVHEARTQAVEPSATTSSRDSPGASSSEACKVSAEDRDSLLAVNPQGLVCQARNPNAWAGGRASTGVRSGKAYYEATVQDEGLIRVGWSSKAASLELGTDKHGFGYGSTGKKSHARSFDDYGGAFKQGDVVGTHLDADAGAIYFSRNGRDLGLAFEVPSHLQRQALYPAMCLKNGEVALNFGGSSLRYQPHPGFTPVDRLPDKCKVSDKLPGKCLVSGASQPATADTGKKRPLALILEPTRDLAEQTHNSMVQMGRHLSYKMQCLLITGGLNNKQMHQELARGVDVVTGTPSRIADMLRDQALDLGAVRFFVLDEADRLVDQDGLEVVMQLFNALPKGGAGTARLQVLFFSATLHSDAVKQSVERLCHNPTWVDLKGKDAVPEAVDHVKVVVDPQEDRTWLQGTPHVPTDNAHAFDSVGPNHLDSPECMSEAVKRLKPRLLQRLIDAYKMDQCLIFCRTNYDCDNLETFLSELGGGQGKFRGKRESGKENPYSCAVLAGKRGMQQRREALDAFKSGDVRFLIATDVAARGIDIAGLPYMVNMTLPERDEDYIHRVGRVGRADVLGLAISIVSAVPEKVWFCTKKGYAPWERPKRQDVGTHEEGGHTIWYSEPELMQAVDRRLKSPVAAMHPDLTLPQSIAKAREASGGSAQQYGQQCSAADNKDLRQHIESLRPAVEELARMETEAQGNFLRFQTQWLPRVVDNSNAAWPKPGHA